MASKPPLDLTVEIAAANCSRTYRWDSGGRAQNIPRGLTFNTKRGDGFADASVSLARRIDQDYVDLNLYDDLSILGADGSVAYEGRVGGMPRSMGDTHSVTVQAAGWMSHARDRKFKEIYVDRDLSRWGPASVTRKLNLGGAYTFFDPVTTTDATVGAPAVELHLDGAWTTYRPLSEALYDAQGVPIGSLYYAWKLGGGTPINTADANFIWAAHVGDGDTFLATDGSGTLRSAGPGTGTLSATTASRIFAMVRLYYDAAPAGGSGDRRSLWWTCLAVYGNHGLTKRGTGSATNAPGIYASDIIRHIVKNWCPRLNSDGVEDTTYPIAQCAFLEAIDPYDAFLDVNKYHLWDIAVWENKTLHYEPFDLTDYDWQIRLSDPGVTVDLQGDSTDQLANGIAVTFPDFVTGKQTRVTPDQYAELRDDSVENPATRAGLKVWSEITLSSPADLAGALQIGRAALAEFNQPKGAGTITARGHIRDRAGHWQPVWKVRSGDTIAVTDHPNDRPRLIVETNYNHDDHSLRVSTDSTAKRLDAFMDRVGTAIQINTIAP
jgi:hypothetical protein